ncbi:hypothetical protein PG997_000054 [Apiospora hydei]|uniref:Uncharacterized protein n=1 Tax=Apiospora hydei TaxID=1337664 RepID=A0ABR1X9M6_9PEZI
MASNNSDKNTKAASSRDDVERGIVAPVQDPEYTINDIYFLLLGLPFSFLASFGLRHWMDIPNHRDLPSLDHEAEHQKISQKRYADQPRQKLNFVFQFGAVIALTIRLCRFCWRHKWDLPVWVTPEIGGFVSAHALRWASGRDNVVDAYTYFMPWTYLGTLVVYVVFRLRQPEQLRKLH